MTDNNTNFDLDYVFNATSVFEQGSLGRKEALLRANCIPEEIVALDKVVDFKKDERVTKMKEIMTELKAKR